MLYFNNKNLKYLVVLALMVLLETRKLSCLPEEYWKLCHEECVRYLNGSSQDVMQGHVHLYTGQTQAVGLEERLVFRIMH